MDCEGKNLRPIVGILSQDCPEKFSKYGTSFIAASYVKYVESAGARVVPIRINLCEEDLENLFMSINGVLFPGGGADLPDSGYFKTAKIIYDLALKAYDVGEIFPIWGTCLGFELLNVLASRLGTNALSSCDAENYSVPVTFTPDAIGSRLFESAPEEVMNNLKQLNITFNMHVKCVTSEAFRSDEKLSDFFNVLSVNKDRNGKEFVSTFEGKKHPVYGTQWHPEKTSFEWEIKEQINHSPEAVSVGQYMANFFVNQARLNTHRFPCEDEEKAALIYQYHPTVTADESTFEQCYFF